MCEAFDQRAELCPEEQAPALAPPGEVARAGNQPGP